ncbi:MAG: O-antigen ligase family protein [Candidatus Magasanikiibacteriota bacterium]
MNENFLTKQSIFFNWQTFVLLIVFFGIRIMSFFLVGHTTIQGGLVFLILMILGILYFKNPNWAWGLVLGEILLGGSGHYLEFLGLSIRTVLIFFFMFLWLAQLIGEQTFHKIFDVHSRVNYILIILFLILGFAVGNGLYNGHEFKKVVGDLMPFAFLLLTFPSYHLFANEKTQKYLIRLIMVFILGTAIFSLITFALFSLHITELHLDFYQWYRDVDMGKITDMTQGFFRIVEPAHLLVVPFILLITSLRMRDEKHNKMWLIFLTLLIIILVLNLSRGYFLALLVGLLVLKYKHKWKNWFKECFVTILLIGIVFSSIHFLASGNKSLGWDLFGLRIKSMAVPSLEVSTDTRMMILPVILDTITANPILGVGLGASITFLNTATYESITTTQFDWGYLEMWAETGIFGLIILTALYMFVAYKLIIKIKNIPDWHDFDIGLLAGITAFLIMNITIPALFHVYGILFLVFVGTIALKHTLIFDQTTTLLYQIFNRTK